MKKLLREACLLALLFCSTAKAEEKDYTSYITNASCSSTQDWVISGNTNGTFQLDTWSGRGSKDGSNMTTPFLEYWAGNGTILSNATILHEQIDGLPAGTYRLSVQTRLYRESSSALGTDLSGLSLVYMTNNDFQIIPIDNGNRGSYNGQPFEYITPSVEFHLADDDVLVFGFQVADANFSWLSFKNVTLTLLAADGGDDGDGDGDEGDGDGDGDGDDTPSGETPDALESGSYYLRNVETGRYFQAGGKYGTQAVAGKHGLPISITRIGDNQYTLDAGFNNNGLTYIGIDGNDMYVDMGRTIWTITPNEYGNYNIAAPDGRWLGYNSSSAIAPTNNAYTSKACQWEFISRKQMLEELLDGSQVDATFLIQNPRMDRSYTVFGWSEGDTGGADDNWVMEKWNTAFDSNQTLSNIPNGRYRLTVQGFYRYNETGSNNNYYPYYYQVQRNYNHTQYAQWLRAELYANNASSPIRSIADEYNSTRSMGFGSGSAYYLPFSMSNASQCFTAGLYSPNGYGDNQVEVNVTDHTLTIGVRNQNHYNCDWTVWDNYELTLLSLGDNSDYSTSTDFDAEDASFDNPIDVSHLLESPHPNAWKSYTTATEQHTLSDLPNGLYRLRLHGFYCYGDIKYQQEYSYDYGNQECVNNKVYAMYTIPYATMMEQKGQYKAYARLFANGLETGFPSIFADAHPEPTHSGDKETELGYVPGSQTGAREAFNAGEYAMELLVPVTDGTLQYGVRKQAGYKNDLAAWDGYTLEYLGTDRMVYADDLQIITNTATGQQESSIAMTAGETRQLAATILPADATDKRVNWKISGSGFIIDPTTGLLTATGSGSATVYASVAGTDGTTLTQSVQVSSSYNMNSQTDLLINELQVSNVDMFLDPSKNYGAYIELYNPTNLGITTSGMRLSLDGGTTRYSIPSTIVPAHGYSLVWFDHYSALQSQIDNKLDMEGGTLTLYANGGATVDAVSYPAAVSRTSYARTVDGGGFWGITASPTPGCSNNTAEYLDATSYRRLSEPTVSHNSQVFTSPFTLKVDIPEGTTLHYTIDGTTPQLSASNISADGLFDISTTTLLRLRLSQSGTLPSPVKTLSYIQRDKDYTLPVLSVVGNPDDFYNDTTGVFVPGVSGVSGSGVNLPCNWNMDWERPVCFNYFTLDGKTDYSQEADLERCGGWSRSWYPYSFKLKGSDLYEGRSFIEQQIFPDKPHLKQKAWQVRNGGNDLLCRIKDASLQHLITSCGWHVDCQDYSPTHVFINGEYTGMMNIREPNNKHFGYANYGHDLNTMDALELAGGYTVKTGSSTAFVNLRELSYSANDASVWQQITDLLDVDEFANYMAAQIYLGGDDWPGNNCKAVKGEDGKFHIVFFDVDQALRYDAYAMTHVNNNSGCPLIRIFRNLVHYSETFRQKFIDAYCIAAGSVFEPERVNRMITAMAQEMEHALSLEGLEPWTTANNTIRVLANSSRQETMIRALSNLAYTNVNYYDAYRMQLRSNTPEARMQLCWNDEEEGQTIPTGEFNGFVFPGRTLKVTAPMGYRFMGWQDAYGNYVSNDASLYLDNYAEEQLTAIFEEMTDRERLAAFSLPIKVNEVSAGNAVQINDYGKKNDWIELYNNSDMPLDVAGLYVSDDLQQPLKYQIPESATASTIVPAHGHIILWADKLEPVSQLHTNFKLSNTDGSWALVTSSDDFVARNSSYFSQHPVMRNFADGLAYDMHRGDQSVGRYPDGGASFYRMDRTTIERKNMVLTGDQWLGTDLGIMEPSGDFALYLAKGWNWVSLPLSGGTTLTAFDEKVQSIRGQHESAYNDPLIGMTGTLQSMEAEQMYKVLTTATTSYEFGTALVDPATTYISLRQGWNWLGYTVDGAQTVSSALRHLDAEEGDMIVSQDGFATFYDGAWSGTLTTLETGKGYMYRSASNKGFCYTNTTTAGVKMRRDVQRRAAAASRYDRYAYPNVMAVIAQLDIDGTTPEAEAFSVEAWTTSDDGLSEECRGVGQYVGDKLFLTLHGQGGEALTFRLTDQSGQTMRCDTQLTFSSGTMGTMEDPYLISLHGDNGTTGLTDMSDTRGVVSVQYYNMAGQRLLQPMGICIERRQMSDGTTQVRKLNVTPMGNHGV